MTSEGNVAVRNFIDSGMSETQTDAIGTLMNAYLAKITEN